MAKNCKAEISLEDYVQTFELSKNDKLILDKLDIEKVRSAIACLKTCDDILWKDNDTSEIVSSAELDKRNLHLQPAPIYPRQIKDVICHFVRIREATKHQYKCAHNELMSAISKSDNFNQILRMTMLSPWTIVEMFCWFNAKDRFVDGYLGECIRNNTFLRGLLRLEDIYEWYMNRLDEGN